jgi:hypothetical protein
MRRNARLKKLYIEKYYKYKKVELHLKHDMSLSGLLCHL